MKIIGKTWYTPAGGAVIGIVVTEEDGKKEAYIGIGMGQNIEKDAMHIAEWGASFPLKQAEELIK